MTILANKILAKSKRLILSSWAGINNTVTPAGARKSLPPSGLIEFDEIRARSLIRSDISEHLLVMFLESVTVLPKLIVELGTRGGESTYVFERTARLSGGTLVSVDIDDCRRASAFERWHFVRRDDVLFATEFTEWCRTKQIDPAIDILFIDTSHLLEHTLQELRAWFPLLSAKAKVILHDTNMQEIYRRKDGSMDVAWNNERGVIHALELFLGTTFNESIDFVAYKDNWLIHHYHHSLGLTILQRCNLSKL